MGIRIHTAVGYRLKLDGMNLKNLSNYNFLTNKGELKGFANEVMNFSRENEQMEHIHFNRAHSPDYLSDIVIYDSEFGDKDSVLFIPVGYQEVLKRYNDLLDWFAYDSEYPDPGDRTYGPEWREIKGCLHPYIGLMKPNPDVILGIEKYWEPCWLDKPGFEDAIPFAPFQFWFLIKRLGLVGDSEEEITKAHLSLRPYFYRYWS